LVLPNTNAIRLPPAKELAYLRLDLLQAPDQTKLKPRFRDYVESRIKTYQLISQGTDVAMAEYIHSQALQNEIWHMATVASTKSGNPAVMTLVLTPINEMIDITTTRFAATRAHPPLVIYGLLFIFAIATALLVGYGASFSKEAHWLHKVLFAFCITGTIYATLDLEYPRRGLIRSDTIDSHFHDLLRSIQEPVAKSK